MALSFIETQFPVSKLSKESYKERKAGNSQTLTSLGKWWGRKPLILVRAVIVGLLLPTSNNPRKDREIFLKILTMDDEGLLQRKSKIIPVRELYLHLTSKERDQWFDPTHQKLKDKITDKERQTLQRLVFDRLSYDEKLIYCERPEQIEGPSDKAWKDINSYLGTAANNLPELIQQLGKLRFGRVPCIGDAFCGGGSVPFEAARMGCEAYGSDLSPVAALLTWASLNIVGGGKEAAGRVEQAQKSVYQAVNCQITEWGIEQNEKGWRADAYLYCNETNCPECGWSVPLAPSWVIGQRTRCIAKLEPDEANQCFEIQIASGVSDAEMTTAKESGTVKSSIFVCPHCYQSNPLTSIRGRNGLRSWKNEDVAPRPDDVLQERLYCIRWIETYIDSKGNQRVQRHYLAPTYQDFEREGKVLSLLKERFQNWQENSYIECIPVLRDSC